MGGRGSNYKASGTITVGGGSLSSMQMANPNAKPVTELSMNGASPNYVSNAVTAQNNNNANFSATDNADYHQLYNGRQYFQNQSLTIDQRVATQNYLSDQPEVGSLYSMSQNMNYNLANGHNLSASQQYTYNYMKQAMHNLGYNLNLQRYDHADFIDGLLKATGVNSSYDTMTETQLKKALVGTSYQTKSFTSVSYNNFQNAPSSNPFTSRAVKIEYSAKAKTQAMMPGNGTGGKLGEIVLSNSNSYKITNVKFDTTRLARKKQTQSYTAKAVTIYVDVE